MPFTVYQYSDVTEGDPVEPPAYRDIDVAFGAPFLLDPGTVFVSIITDAAAHLRVSETGEAATADDHRLDAGRTYGFRVSGRRAQLHVISAS